MEISKGMISLESFLVCKDYFIWFFVDMSSFNFPLIFFVHSNLAHLTSCL